MSRITCCPNCGKFFVYKSADLIYKLFFSFRINASHGVKYHTYRRKLYIDVLWNWTEAQAVEKNPIEDSDESLRKLLSVAHSLQNTLYTAYLASIEYDKALELATQQFLRLWDQTEPDSSQLSLPKNTKLLLVVELPVEHNVSVSITCEYCNGQFVCTTSNTLANIVCLAAALPPFTVTKATTQVALSTQLYLFGAKRSVDVWVNKRLWQDLEKMCQKLFRADPFFTSIVEKSRSVEEGRSA